MKWGLSSILFVVSLLSTFASLWIAALRLVGWSIWPTFVFSFIMMLIGAIFSNQTFRKSF